MDGPIRGILFDLGDTLIDFAHVSMTAAFKQGARLGYAYLEGLGKSVPPFAAFHRRQLWAIRWNYVKAHLVAREFNSLDLMVGFAEKWGYELSDAERLELAWRFYTPLSEAATVVPGAKQALTTLAGEGIRIGLISNTFLPASVLDRHLDITGLGELIDTRIYSSDVRYRKPHIRIFQIALERIGLDAGRTMFVGDSPRADIFGANRAGMTTVLRDHPRRRRWTRTAPDHRLVEMTELPQIVAQRNACEGG